MSKLHGGRKAVYSLVGIVVENHPAFTNWYTAVWWKHKAVFSLPGKVAVSLERQGEMHPDYSRNSSSGETWAVFFFPGKVALSAELYPNWGPVRLRFR